MIEGLSVPMLLDTGASRTIISESTYKQIPCESRPQIIEGVKCPQLRLADGTRLGTLGCTRVRIQVDSTPVECDVIVAAVSDPGILGLDFLRQQKCQINLESNEMVMKSQNGSTSVREQSECNVALRDDCIVAAHSEAIIPADVSSCLEVPHCLVSGKPEFEEKYQLKVASSLGNPCEGWVPVRILNPRAEDVHLFKGTVMGCAERVESVEPFLQHERETLLSNDASLATIEEDSSELLRPNSSEAVYRPSDIPKHLVELFERSKDNLSEGEQARLIETLIRYQSAFAKDSMDLGRTDIIEHTIDTGDAKPIKQRPRQTPLAFREQEAAEIQKMLDKGIIVESNSPWSSPVVLVRKADNSIRFCVDYRKLNKVTKLDTFPLPKISECFQSLAGSQVFSVMDLASGYWQIKVREEDQPKTTFVTKHGAYMFRVLPFGLVNGPSSFERCMEAILSPLQWVTCLIYLDDILVHSRTISEHLERLEQVLQRIQGAGLKLKPAKCCFFQQSVPFLGHVVSGEGISTDPEKIEAVRNWKPPTNLKALRSFLGFCGYYRCHVEGFAKIAHPLTQLTCKGKEFIWTEDCQQAFELLKERLTTTPIMTLPNDDDLFVVDVDASDFGLGGVLSQVQDQQEKVVSYASRTLNKSERRYCVTRRELLALVYCLKHYRYFLLGRKFLVRSDHQALQWLFSLKDPSGQIARWLEFLSEYNFTIEYRPGSKHSNADGMSRCDPHACDCVFDTVLSCGPCNKCNRYMELMSPTLSRVTTRASGKDTMETRSQSDLIGVFQQYTRGELKEFQMQDPDIAPILIWKNDSEQRPGANQVVAKSPATRNLWLCWDMLVVNNGILYKQTKGKLRFVVPIRLHPEILETVHNSPLSGHLGYRKSLSRLSCGYYWYHMKESVYEWVKKCDTCSSNVRPRKTAKAPLGNQPVGAVGDRLCVDLLGPLPLTPRGNRHLMVAVDWFSKWVELYPIPDATSETCAEKLVNEYMARYGLPLSIHTDQATYFESDLIKHICQVLHLRKTRASSKHPAGNGVVERFMSTVVKMIKAFLNEKETDWDLNLGCLAGAYRSTEHESTGFSANKLMLGRETRMPAELMFGDPPGSTELSYGDYVRKLKADLQLAHKVARENLKQAAKRQKHNYDMKLSFKTFKPGDVVWLLNETRKPHRCHKLQPMWLGPCLISKRYSDLNFEIQLDKRGRHRVIHHDKLKPYLGDTFPKWLFIRREQILKGVQDQDV